MKKLFILLLLLGLIPSVKADSVCVLTSETYPDVTIKLRKLKGLGKSIGTLDYKNKPAYKFRTGVQNGYWKHYYVISELSSDDSKKNISVGRFLEFVGNQPAPGTPKEDRKPGKLKVILPDMSTSYYYHLDNVPNEEGYGRFNQSPLMKSILKASDNFFAASNEECSNGYFIYGGNGWKK
tara:strand:+ start:1269 stop:1808 length:540 start_codon:yes stop_codon:yes gene_type:complete